jgi:hypothetical protein
MTNQTPGSAYPERWPAAPKNGFLASLGPRQKAGIFLGGALTSLLLIGCGMGGESPDAKPAQSDAAAAAAMPSISPTAGTAVEGVATSPTPLVEKRTVTANKSIPHGVKRVNDSTLAKGKTRVKTQGVNGTKKITYEVTVTDGVETARVLIREEVVKQPVTEVILVGTKTTTSSSCDKNYSGCVPIASDVDCAGGSGNGPKYVQGPIRVIGSDIYDLDSDNDGIACE